MSKSDEIRICNVRNVLQSDKESSNITWNKEEHTYMFL